MEMESLTGDITEDSTDVSKRRTAGRDEEEDRKADEDEEDETQTESLTRKNEALQREFEKAEEVIKTLTKEKSEALETNINLTKEKSEAAETINTLAKERAEAAEEHKLKVETLESQIAKLREELSKKA